MFIRGEQGRKAIGLAIMSTTASYLFSMIYIVPNFKPLTSWMSLFLENINNKSGGEQRHKKRPSFWAHFTGSKGKKEQNWPNN